MITAPATKSGPPRFDSLVSVIAGHLLAMLSLLNSYHFDETPQGAEGPASVRPIAKRHDQSASRSIPTSTAQRPILLAVDQQLGEGATLRVAPELADPVGSLEVGEHHDVEQVRALRSPCIHTRSRIRPTTFASTPTPSGLRRT